MGTPSRLPVPVPEPPPMPRPLREEPKKPGNWKYWIVAAMMAGGAVLAYQLLHRPGQGGGGLTPAVPTARIETGVFERTVRLSGETSARNFAAITVPMMRGPDATQEMVLIELAEAGGRVKIGDLVAKIDARTAENHIEDVKSMVLQAESSVTKRRAEHAVDWGNLQQSLRVAKATLDKARLDFQAAEIRTTIDQELLKLYVEECEARYKQLQSNLALQKEVQQAELRNLDIARQRQVMHLDRHLGDLKRMTFHTPMNGLVVMASFYRAGERAQIQLGDQVRSGQTIMKIVDTSTMQVETSANQSESSQLRIGQPAMISLDAFPGLRLKGRVYSIGAMGIGGFRLNYYVRSVPVRVAIEDTDPRLIPDLSAAADVVVEKQENALLVPLSAVRSRNGKEFVMVKTGKGFQRRDIQLGKRNSTSAIVVSGVTRGEQVAVGELPDTGPPAPAK